MGSITLLKNIPGIMTPQVDFIDSGWEISNGYATHYPCNAGYIISVGIDGIQLDVNYEITYEVTNYVSGSVRLFSGTEAGSARTANGVYTENVVFSGTTVLKFYSNGYLTIGKLVIYDLDAEQQPVTIAFSEKHKLWVNQQNVPAENFVRFGDDFFAFKNGNMYKQDSNEVRNNFFGDQFSSEITFYVNSDPASVKLFHNLIEESNGKWEVISAKIKPYPGKNLGMQTRIKPDRLKELQGIYYADFLRNMLDPRFGTQIEALLRGEEMRGRVMEITIRNSDTTEVTLFAVDVKYSTQMLTP